MKRLFFALWPDLKTREYLNDLIQGLDRSVLKPVQANNIHVTLVFLGSVDAIKIMEIKNCVSEISGQSFQIVFDQLHYWRKPGVLCLGSSEMPQEIISLSTDLNRRVSDSGIDTDKRAYFAHVTLARKVRKKIEFNVEPLIWKADSFSLVESISTPDGPQYTAIDSWPLTA